MKKLIFSVVITLIFLAAPEKGMSKNATLVDVTNVVKNFSDATAFSAPATAANGVVTYVAAGGSNNNQGTNPWSPYATLLYATTNLHGGNTIALAGTLSFTNVFRNGVGPVCWVSNITVIGNNNTVMLTNNFTGNGAGAASTGLQVQNDTTIKNVALCGYYPTNLYFTLRIVNGSLVRLINDTIGGTSDGIYQNQIANPVTTIGINCNFTSCWDTVNFSPINAGTNAVNKFLNCNFRAVADAVPTLNKAVKFRLRANGYFQVGGGTTWAKNCSFSGANGTSQTYGFYIQGPGAVAYLSGCSVAAKSTHGGDVKQFYIDGATVYTDFWVDPHGVTLTNGGVLNTNMLSFSEEAFLP